MIVHLVSAENEDVVAAYKTIRKELEVFDKTLLDKKEIVIISKTDTTDSVDLENKKIKLEKELAKTVQTISLYEDTQTKKFSDTFLKVLQEDASHKKSMEISKIKHDDLDEDFDY
jgi:GTPase